MNSFFDIKYAVHILPELLRASMYTIGITLVGFAIALVLGLVLAILRRSTIAPVARVTGFFVEFIRSTPLLIQVYVLFYVAPLYGLTMSALSAGTIGIAVHYACYVSEVYRAGLNGVARGQWEAACALSLSPWRTYSGVILPQAIRPVIPALGNRHVQGHARAVGHHGGRADAAGEKHRLGNVPLSRTDHHDRPVLFIDQRDVRLGRASPRTSREIAMTHVLFERPAGAC